MIWAVAMTYIPSFIKIGSAIKKFMREGGHTHRQHGDRISLLSFFQNKKSRLKTSSTVLHESHLVTQSEEKTQIKGEHE
jgi:hypothetical protein